MTLRPNLLLTVYRNTLYIILDLHMSMDVHQHRCYNWRTQDVNWKVWIAIDWCCTHLCSLIHRYRTPSSWHFYSVSSDLCPKFAADEATWAAVEAVEAVRLRLDSGHKALCSRPTALPTAPRSTQTSLSRHAAVNTSHQPTPPGRGHVGISHDDPQHYIMV